MTVKELREILDNVSTEYDDLDVIISISGPQKLQMVDSAEVGIEFFRHSVYSNNEPDNLFIISPAY